MELPMSETNTVSPLRQRGLVQLDFRFRELYAGMRSEIVRRTIPCVDLRVVERRRHHCEKPKLDWAQHRDGINRTCAK